jgi:hypothetical protein
MKMDVDGEEPLTAGEREALALWRAAEPPADLAERVLARLEGERGAGVRPLAVAALAAALVVGVAAARLLSAAGPALPVSGGLAGDGGSAGETGLRGADVADGVRS